MSMSVKIEKNFAKLGEDVIKKAKGRFYINAAAALPPLIVDAINKGISPVEGDGRYQSYSNSYRDQIDGKVQFRYIGGKTVPFYPKVQVTREKLYGAEFNKGAKKGQNLHDQYKKGTTSKISFRQSFGKGLGYNKLKSPVNLRVTGEMLKSIQSKYDEQSVTISFTSPIAKYHNNLSNGKMFRPMLPYGGKKFSSLIMKKLRDLLRDAFNN